MSKIIIIGAGAMGSAFALPCLDNNHDINIVGTHLENDFTGEMHPEKWKEIINNELNPLFNRSIKSFSRCVPTILTSWLLSKQGKAKAEPIAPAPIIIIFDINL